MKYPWVPRRTERLSRQRLHDYNVTCSLHGGFYFENWMASLCCCYVWLPASFICIFTHRVKWVPSAPTISNNTRKNIKNRWVSKTSVFHWKLKKPKTNNRFIFAKSWKRPRVSACRRDSLWRRASAEQTADDPPAPTTTTAPNCPSASASLWHEEAENRSALKMVKNKSTRLKTAVVYRLSLSYAF